MRISVTCKNKLLAMSEPQGNMGIVIQPGCMGNSLRTKMFLGVSTVLTAGLPLPLSKSEAPSLHDPSFLTHVAFFCFFF